MPKLPRISANEVVRVLEKLGFSQSRQKGSHLIMRKDTPNGNKGCVVPMHKTLAVGTLRSILRQSQITPEEFIKNL
ncbi:MAG: type II toxin-antitoxin system HicA family toxin [Candidatus Gracilibacteria bacterium]